MYSELIKWLWECASGECFNCSHKGNASCPDDLMKQAADAIEELQLYVDLYKDLAEKAEKVAKEVIDKYPKWIPVTERLPEDGTEVLAFNKTGFAYVDCWTDGKWKIISMVDEEHESVNHWMPLPEPPKDGEA